MPLVTVAKFVVSCRLVGSVLSSYVVLFTGVCSLCSATFGCTTDQAGTKVQDTKRGHTLADQYCVSCHLKVDPSELPKEIWREHVLPHMAHRLGIYGQKEAPDSLFKTGISREEAIRQDIFPVRPKLSLADWHAVRTYYLENATENRAPSHGVDSLPQLSGFTPFMANYTRKPPLTSMIKILPKGEGIVLGDGKKNVNALIKLDPQLNLVDEIYVKNAPIDYVPLPIGAMLLSCGKNIYPSDRNDGELEYIYSQHSQGKPDRSDLILDDLKRPVHMSRVDLNQDQKVDYVICEFGHHIGRLSVFQSEGDSYVQQTLINRPGAIKTQIADIDNDGWKDIVVLMSQGQEEIRVCYNKQGDFSRQKTWLSFSPLFGSTSFSLLDWNGDEHFDVLYTCGDNADLSVIDKDYHGIYLFENTGKDALQQVFFYALPGAYQAIPLDFDADNDLDIAAIAYFPNYASKTPRSFVYLENQGDLDFTASTLAEAKVGRWMVMDAGDIDMDGDTDLALGSFVGFYPDGANADLFENWIERGPSVLLLKNNLYQLDGLVPDNNDHH